jgi:hypothetical protein
MSSLLLKKTERLGDFTKAVREAIASRLNSAGRAAWTFATREDQSGTKLKTSADVVKEMGSNLIPIPISGSAALRAGKQLVTGQPEEKFPGQYQRQAFQTLGMKLDSVPSDEQRIKALATDFNKTKGVTPSAEFYHGDYYDLDRALMIGNQRETQKALADLLEKKTAAQIKQHYNVYARAPFTGKISRENDFKDTLNQEQLQAYERARQRRQDLRDHVSQAVDSMPAPAGIP